MALLEYQPRQTLYHYCSVDGFRGVLASKALWFSDLEALNDPREIVLGFEQFLAALKDIRHDEYEGHTGFPLSVLAGRLTSMRAIMRSYCCCFSLEGDSLPLWGEYTGHVGLSIGFRPTAIHDIQGRVQKAQYLDSETPEIFRAKALDIAAMLIGEDGVRGSEYWLDASVAAFAMATALKHSSWSHEREVRMVFMQGKEPLSPEEDLKLKTPEGEDYVWVTPSVRRRGDRDISYIAFPFGRYRDGDERHRRAIERVTVGPNCPLSDDEVSLLLDQHGYVGVNVVRSTCMIR